MFQTVAKIELSNTSQEGTSLTSASLGAKVDAIYGVLSANDDQITGYVLGNGLAYWAACQNVRITGLC